MSYILDALKKAADQRGAKATVLLRPLAPVRRVSRLGRLPWIVIGALLLLNMAVLGYVLQPAQVITPVPQPTLPKVALIQPIEPPPPAPTQVIPAEPPPAAVALKPPAAAATAKILVEKPATEKTVVRAVPDARPPAAARVAPVDPKPAVAAPAKADAHRFQP